MTDNDELVHQAESVGGWQRVFLILQAVSYIGWIGSKGLAYVPGISLDADTFRLIEMICLPLWIIGILATFWLMRRVAKNRQLASMLYDERSRELVGRVFQITYWVLLVVLALLYAAVQVVTIDARAAIALLTSLAVAVPSLTSAALYRD